MTSTHSSYARSPQHPRPTAPRFLDLSVALEDGGFSDPPPLRPEVHYTSHAQGAAQLALVFPGLRAEDLSAAEGWAVEDLAVSTHNGTHVDAPWHFASIMNASTVKGPERAWTIDEVPLDWFFRPGVKLDFRDKPHGHVVSAEEVQEELERIEHTLEAYEIVLLNTGAGALYGHPEYVHSGCGMGREATLWLLERGVRVTGTDGWSWDAPFCHTGRRFAETGNPSIVWEGHKAGREIGYCHIEKLTNLDLLPPTGFVICCFPYKIKGASAGFTRAVAIFNE
jgi:kynurenine formamidase